jgi:hypothetical protein
VRRRRSSGPAGGRIAAADLTSHAEALVSALSRREGIARETSALACAVGRVPGEVSRARAESLVRAAGDLIQDGGEVPPVLRRDPR